MIQLLFLVLFIISGFNPPKVLSTFTDVQLKLAGEVKSPLDFAISFRTTRVILANERIGVVLPRFTQRLDDYEPNPSNITFSELIISPSTRFQAEWLEGINVYGDEVPYPSPLLVIKTRNGEAIGLDSFVNIRIYKENGIGAVCGFASSTVYQQNTSLVYSSPPFTIATLLPSIYAYNETVLFMNTSFNAAGVMVRNESLGLGLYTFYRNVSYFNDDLRAFDFYQGLGGGCSALRQCYGQGQCDFCYEQCRCFRGFGHEADVVGVGYLPSLDCSERVCPAGRAFGDVPTAPDSAHRLAECSGSGLCNRTTGQCECFEPYGGAACDISKSPPHLAINISPHILIVCLATSVVQCPRNCSGRGQCLSMADLARTLSLPPAGREQVVYGSGAGMDSVAWDHRSIFGCACDSSWRVGLDAGEVQLGEFFGPDCSLSTCRPLLSSPYCTNQPPVLTMSCVY
ncbi:hypothetical protein EON64_05325 [archaeon]|nr:MAG: hypothetical protein EON64_05325 [archaeon]